MPTEQCVCMNKQCACAVCVCLWCVSEQRDCYRLGTSTHQPTTSNCGQCSELDEHTLFLPLFLALLPSCLPKSPFQLFSLHLFLSLHPQYHCPPLHTHTPLPMPLSPSLMRRCRLSSGGGWLSLSGFLQSSSSTQA